MNTDVHSNHLDWAVAVPEKCLFTGPGVALAARGDEVSRSRGARAGCRRLVSLVFREILWGDRTFSTSLRNTCLNQPALHQPPSNPFDTSHPIDHFYQQRGQRAERAGEGEGERTPHPPTILNLASSVSWLRRLPAVQNHSSLCQKEKKRRQCLWSALLPCRMPRQERRGCR